jgi:hypothetical protein
MIRSFEPPQLLEPESDFQWSAAWGAGLIAGIILLVAPRGSPWSSLTFLAPVVMGRVVPPEVGFPFFGTLLVHMGLSLVYGLIISWVITSVTRLWAIVVGGFAGLVLYLINLGIVSTWFPQLRSNEVPVIFTHVVFGLIAGGAYRGLLRRKQASLPANP